MSDHSVPEPTLRQEDEPTAETPLWEYLHVLLQRRWLILAVFAVVTTQAVVRTNLIQPVYRGVTQLLIERQAPSVLAFKEVTEVNAGWWGEEYFQTQYRVLQSRALARRVIENMKLYDDPEFGGPRPPEQVKAMLAAAPGESPAMEGLIGAFLGRVSISPIKDSRVVSVGVDSVKPELAARMANRLAQVYIAQTLDFRYQTSAEAGHWLGDQIDDQRKKVEAAELALEKVREDEGVVNLEERRTLLNQKLTQLGSSLTEIKTQRMEKQALYEQMRRAAHPEDLADVTKNPLVQAQLLELANLERKESQLLETYLDQHPEVIKVRSQIREAKEKIRSEAARAVRGAEGDYQAAAAQEGSVAAALEGTKAELVDLQRRAIPYDTRKRELDAAKSVLDSLLARHKETDVTQELKSTNIRVLDAAVIPTAPIRPQKMRDILNGILLGLGLGIGLAFFLEYLDNTLRTPDDIKRYLGVPFLGVVPELADKKAGRIVGRHLNIPGPFAEGYRIVRTALRYSWPDRDSRVLVLTSTAPGEGKTLTSVNLAATLAALDGQVLLIDGDLRKPNIHVVLGAKKSPGLSDVLVGKRQPMEALQAIPGAAGAKVFFLSAGTHAPSPADLMTDKALRGILDKYRTLFRWIIIDTPPMGAVADAVNLASFADGVVVVAGAEMVPRKAVRHTLDRIAESGARLLGIVLNRAQVEKHAYYYGHYYGHYYGDYSHRSQAEGGDAGKVTTVQ
jgi:succinoglycan biosynthesis transport protein ExoP